MRFWLLPVFALALFALSSCVRPSVLVCQEVNAEGVCRLPTTELEVGRAYTLYAAGVGMPHGLVKVEVYFTRRGRDERIAESTLHVPEDAVFFTRPLRLIHRGRYRIDVIDEDGDVWKSVRIDAPRSMFSTAREAAARTRATAPAGAAQP